MKSLRRPSELIKRGYSSEELDDLYALSVLLISKGENSSAEVVARGLTQVAPDFVPGWLSLSVVMYVSGNIGEGIAAAKQALQVEPESLEAMLFFVCGLINEKDFASAGAYLGEAAEIISRAAQGVTPEIHRFYRSQLVRYQTRT